MLLSLLIILIVASCSMMPATSAGIIVSSGSRRRQHEKDSLSIRQCINTLSDKGDEPKTIALKRVLCKDLVMHLQCPDVSSDLSRLASLVNENEKISIFFNFYRERFITGCGYFYPHLKSPPDYRSMRDWSEYFSDVWAYIT